MPWETNHKCDRRPGSNPHMLEREAERVQFGLRPIVLRQLDRWSRPDRWLAEAAVAWPRSNVGSTNPRSHDQRQGTSPLIRSVPGQVAPEGDLGEVEVGKARPEAPAFDSPDLPNIGVGLYEQPGLEIAERDRHRQASSPKACATYRTSTG